MPDAAADEADEGSTNTIYEIWYECGDEADCAHEEIEAASINEALQVYIATFGICGCGRGADEGWGQADAVTPDGDEPAVCWQITGTHSDGREFRLSALEPPSNLPSLTPLLAGTAADGG